MAIAAGALLRIRTISSSACRSKSCKTSFEAGIVEGHARQVRAIEHGISVRRAVTIDKADCALDHLGLPRALFVLGTLT